MSDIRRPRGRPRSINAENVLEAVLDVFWTKGYAAASLDDLAAAARVTRPSLYAALGDKRAMYLRAIDHFEAGLRDQLKRSLDPNLSLEEGVLDFYLKSIEIYLSGATARGCLVVCTAPAAALDEPEIKDALERILRTIDGAFLARWKVRKSSGDEASAKLAAGVVHSLAIRARSGADRSELTNLARTGAKMFAESRQVRSH